jgi:hypothetical protein
MSDGTSSNTQSLLIDISTVAVLCGGVHVRTIERWVKAGIIPKPLIVNGRPRWQRAKIVEWVNLGCPRRTMRRR